MDVQTLAWFAGVANPDLWGCQTLAQDLCGFAK